MALPISPVAGIPAAHVPARIPVVPPAEPGAFQALLKESAGAVESAQAGAQASVDRFLSGEGEELHHVALATQKAELSFEMFMQVRNKVVQAYQDIMRMQM